MAQGIGDYIHWHMDNYRRYGTQLQSRTYRKSLKKDSNGNVAEGQNDVGKVYNKVSRDLQNRLNNLSSFQDKKELEDSLNFFGSKADFSETSQRMQEAILELLEEEFRKALRAVNFENYNVTADKLHKAKTSNEKLFRNALKERDTYLSTILRRVQTIENLYSTVAEADTEGELKAKINKLYDLLMDIVRTNSDKKREAKKEIREVVKNVSGKGNEHLIKSGKLKDIQGVNLITYINDILNDELFKGISLAQQKGLLFEYAIAAIAAQADIEANEATDKSIKDIIKKYHYGNKVSYTSYNTNNFGLLDRKILDAEMKGYSSSGDIYQSTIASQGKLDVALNWKDKIYRVSAKNVNFKSPFDVSLVNGTPLLYLLQDEYHRFVNHYLNITAEHPDADKNNSSEYKRVIELTKKIVLYKALTGKTFGKGALSAEIFIINDNSSAGTVKVYDMKDLLTTAFKDIDSYAIITGNDLSFNDLTFKNTFAKSGIKERITNLLMDVHATKMDVALKKSVFKKASDTT